MHFVSTTTEGDCCCGNCRGWYCCEDTKEVIYIDNCEELAELQCPSDDSDSSSDSDSISDDISSDSEDSISEDSDSLDEESQSSVSEL